MTPKVETVNNSDNIRSLAKEMISEAFRNQSKVDEFHKKFVSVKSGKHWKDPCGCKTPLTFEEAVVMYASIAFYHGGCEISEGEGENRNSYAVFSKGYYFYCGA